MSQPPAPETRAITLEVELPSTPEEVTRMLSDPAELARWFAPFVDGSGQVGELLTFGWTPEMQWSTRLEAVTPGRLVRWHDAPAEQGPAGALPPMVVEWTLTPTGGGTRLRLVQSGFGRGADWDDQYDATEAGWRFFLWHLAETLRHHGVSRGASSSSAGRAVSPARRWARDSSVRRRSRSPLPDRRLTHRPGSGWPAARGPSRCSMPGCPRTCGASSRSWAAPCSWSRWSPVAAGPLNTGLYLSTWTLEPGTLDALRTGLRSLADAVFGPAPV